jgi:hypothetical protein
MSIESPILGEMIFRAFPSTLQFKEASSTYPHSVLYSFNNCVYAVLTLGLFPVSKISEIVNQLATP